MNNTPKSEDSLKEARKGYEEAIKRLEEEGITSIKKEEKVTPDPFEGIYENFKFIGKRRKKKKKKPVNKPIAEIIREHTEATVLFMNVNSVVSQDKQEKVKLAIKDKEPTFLILAETKMDKDDPEFKVEGYWLVTQVNRKSGAGGMLVLAKNNIDVTNFKSVSVVKEVQVVHFSFNDHLIIGVYRSPNYIGPPVNQHKCLINHLQNLLNKVPKDGNVMIIGDLNLPDLARAHFRPTNNQVDKDGFYIEKLDDKSIWTKMWIDFFEINALTQRVDKPSRGGCPNILDLVITPLDQEPKTIVVDQELFHNTFDHFALIVTIETNYTTEETMMVKRIFNKKNLTNLRKKMGEANLYASRPIIRAPLSNYVDAAQVMTSYAINSIFKIFNREVPLVECKPPPKKGYFRDETVRFMKCSNRVKWQINNKKMSDEKKELIKQKLKSMNKMCAWMQRRDQTHNEIQRFQINAKRGKNFYTYVKKVRGKTSKIGPMRDIRGNLKSKKKEMAVAYGEYLGNKLKPDRPIEDRPTKSVQDEEMFQNQLPMTKERHEREGIKGKTPFPDWFKMHPDSPEELTHQHLYIDEELVIKQIKKAKRNSAPGPDQIPMIVYAVCARELAPLMAENYSLITQTAGIPSNFLETEVIALKKKGDNAEMKNYRPVSMENQYGKTWERCVNEKIMEHLLKHDLISKNQDGFIPGRGTHTSLIKVIDKVMGKVEEHESLVEEWNFDLTQAFDKVDHGIALELCHKAGIGGYLGLSIQRWLTERRQYVRMGASKSEETRVGRSCIQGSVLGPTIWAIYINTLLERLDKKKEELDFEYSAYADDLSIIKHIESDEEVQEMEEILDILQKWSEEFSMIWSPAKTQRIVFKRKYGREPMDPRIVHFNGTEIKPMETKEVTAKMESLGIIISKNLAFQHQIEKVAGKIANLTKIMRKFFVNRPDIILKSFYYAYLYPHQIYCCWVWQPGKEKYLQIIEDTVKKYWRMSLKGGPPKGFLMPILNYILLDQIMVHKIKMGYSSIKFDDIFKMCKPGTKGEREEWIEIKKTRFDVSKQQFSIRAAVFYNALPKEIRREKSEMVFKKRAEKHILENKNDYENMTRDYKISGSCPTPKKRVVKVAINRIKKAGKLLKTGSPRAKMIGKRKGGLATFIPIANKNKKNLTKKRVTKQGPLTPDNNG